MTDTTEAGLPARYAALDLLAAALGRRAGLDEGLSAPALAKLEPRDRAFARALTMAVLRRLGPIDRALDARLQRPPPPAVRDILRLGVGQAFLLELPGFAAVSTSVELAARRKETRPFKGLVNAVLRGLLREPPVLDDPAVLAPDWLLARWRAAYGEAEALALCAVIGEEPATDLTPRAAADAPELASALEAEILPGPTLRTPRRGEVSAWPGYAEGRWWVQDVAAAIPARLLAAQPGEAVLDMCAAPGGKTLQLAAAGAQVVALDRSAARVARLSENLARTGFSAELIATDAAAWDDPRAFDAVLLDAPCSATGTFRRHPDVLWTCRPSDVASLTALQARLLDAAAQRVRPGGRLVYCVCSLEPEEGEAQVAAFLSRHPDFARAPVAPGEGGAPAASITRAGDLRLLPHHVAGGADGFFAARLVRSENSPQG